MGNCYEKEASVFWRKIDDQVLLIHNDRIYNLKNDSAVRMWELIDGKSKVSQIGEKIKEEFGIELSEAGKDLAGFIQQLKEAGLIKPVG